MLLYYEVTRCGNGGAYSDHELGGLDGLIKKYNKLKKQDLYRLGFSNTKYKCLPELDGTFTVIDEHGSSLRTYKSLKCALKWMERPVN